jgi:hypothetical protein
MEHDSRRLRSKRENRRLERDVADFAGLGWLDERPSKARSRVIRLIELLRVASRLASELRKYGETVYGDLLDNPQYVVNVRQYERVLRDINDILARYLGTRDFGVGNGYPLKAGFMESRIKKLPAKIHWTSHDDSYWTETMLINYLLQLAAKGSIDRVRSCRECHKWFYAITAHQKNCSQACRQKFASHDHLFKKRRREYMKEYRENEREREKRFKQVSLRAE